MIRAMNFADFLREQRERIGLTQVQTAMLLDVSPSTIAAWEGGAEPPSLTMEGAKARLIALQPGDRAQVLQPTTTK